MRKRVLAAACGSWLLTVALGPAQLAAQPSTASPPNSGDLQLPPLRSDASLDDTLGSDSPLLRRAAVEAVIDSKLKLTDAQLGRLLGDPEPSIRLRMAWYSHFTVAQAKQLIASGDTEVVSAFAQLNPASSASPEIVAALIAAKLERVDWVLVSNKRFNLSDADFDVLLQRASPALRIALSQRRQSPVDAAEVAATAGSSSNADLARLVRMNPVPAEVVEHVLGKGSPELRRQLSMQGHFAPTAEQIERMLDDTEAEVRIGMLRRRDIDIPAQRVNQGAFDADESTAFWYRQRKEFSPSPAQVEEGLSSKRVVLRRSFSNIKGLALTAQQVERGLTDDDETIRRNILARADLRLTPAQLARCLDDRQFSVRQACVQRPDFAVSLASLQTMLTDPNPNVLIAALRAHPEAATALPEYVAQLLPNATPPMLMGLARQLDLPLNSDQIAAGSMHADLAVRAAFQRRSKLKPTGP